MDTAHRLQLEVQTREARRAELQVRTTVHDLRVKRIGRGRRRRASGARAGAHNMPLDFLAIGDSWFDYPLDDNGLLGPNAAIVADGQLGSMGNPPPVILSYALHGQATTAVLSYENQERILNALTDPNTTRWANDVTADGILVSAGGDDVVGDQFAIYVDYHGHGLDKKRFDGALASVQASYLDLIALRDIAAGEVGIGPEKIPIFAHCYDYALPNGIPAGWPIPLSGPWLKPPLDFAGYGPADALNIVKCSIDEFYGLLALLAADKVTNDGSTTNNFILVNTLGTLTRNTIRPNGWANEIHPYTEGFTLLANKFLLSLQGQFPGRI